MAKKEEVYLDPETRKLKIKGDTYVMRKITYKKGGEKKGHLCKEIWVKIDDVEYSKRIDKIVERLESAVDKKKLLSSVLRNLPLFELEKVERRLKKNVKIKDKSGCYNLMIGDFELPVSY